MIFLQDKRKLPFKNRKTFLGFFLVFIVVITLTIIYCTQAPSLEEDVSYIKIPEGYTIKMVTNLLEDNGIIRSSFLANLIIRQRNIIPKSGLYIFKREESLINIINRLNVAYYGDVYKKITIPEGLTNEQIVSLISESDFNIDIENIKELLFNKEGYLFPDTYFFLPDAKGKDIIVKMKKTFSEKINQILKNKTIDKSLSDIVIMASIIEKEASNDLNQKQIISGILWKRISLGIPLQVDAPFLYTIGKGSLKLSNKDLKKESPYNTYLNKGLIPTPICNPGYDSLYAAANPIESDYLFYLHGNDGKIHYGKNYSEHLKNKRMYLR